MELDGTPYTQSLSVSLLTLIIALGQVSFFLLTLQFARSQMLNLGAAPYSDWLKKRRAARLVAEFPKYNHKIVEEFAMSDSFN